MKRITLTSINLKFFFIGLLAFNGTVLAQNILQPQPSATPFNLKLRPDQDLEQPIRVELSAGAMRVKAFKPDDSKNISAHTFSSVRLVARPYQYFYNNNNRSHFLVLPFDIELSKDSRSEQYYLNRVDLPLASWGYDDDIVSFRFNFFQFRHMSFPSHDSEQQIPIQANIFHPVSIEISTKESEDDEDPLFTAKFALPLLLISNTKRVYKQVAQEYTPLLDPALIPTLDPHANPTAFYLHWSLHIPIGRSFELKNTADIETFKQDGIYDDQTTSRAYIHRGRNTLNLDLRLDKALQQSKMGKLTAGLVWIWQFQEAGVGTVPEDSGPIDLKTAENSSKPNLVINHGGLQTFGIRMTWAPANMKTRRQVRMHTRRKLR